MRYIFHCNQLKIHGFIRHLVWVFFSDYPATVRWNRDFPSSIFQCSKWTSQLKKNRHEWLSKHDYNICKFNFRDLLFNILVWSFTQKKLMETDVSHVTCICLLSNLLPDILRHYKKLKDSGSRKMSSLDSVLVAPCLSCLEHMVSLSGKTGDLRCWRSSLLPSPPPLSPFQFPLSSLSLFSSPLPPPPFSPPSAPFPFVSLSLAPFPFPNLPSFDSPIYTSPLLLLFRCSHNCMLNFCFGTEGPNSPAT